MILSTAKLTPNVRALYMELLTSRVFSAAKSKADTSASGIVPTAASELLSVGDHARAAFDELNKILEFVRTAPQPNSYASASDEDIASVIIERITKRRAEQRAEQRAKISAQAQL